MPDAAPDPPLPATLLRQLVEAMPHSVFVKDRDGRYLLFNQVSSDVIGIPVSEIIGRNDAEFRDPATAARLMARDRAVMEAGLPDTQEITVEIRGEPRTFLSTKSPLRDEAGNVIGIIGLSRDITQEKRAEQTLRDSEQLLRLVLAALPVGVAVVNPRGDIIFSNAAFERTWGAVIRQGEPRWEASRAWHHATGIPVAPHSWASARALETGDTTRGELLDIEALDGARRTIVNSAVPIRDAQGRVSGAVIIIEDVTERLKIEEQFRQARKMEAVGHLAGGVAHDFNNLLTVIAGYSEMLLPTLAEDDAAWEPLSEIRAAGHKAAELTRQLLAFSRQSVLAPRVLDLNEVVRDNEKMLRRLIGEDVRLESALEQGLRPVKVDPGQIGQVILNLAVNARDAMPRGGLLTIETRNVTIGPRAVGARATTEPGPGVMLSITDTGEGMRPEVRERIFEPFFTTKPTGKGTGLGLATVYGIVDQSGGFIEVESEVGRGTTFRVFLPPAPEDEAAPAAPPAATPPAQRGSETVLLVEDEDAVRAITSRVLRRFGYTVLEAGRGEEALELAARHQGPIHLMITDVVMPGMGGREVAERIAAVRPDIRVLYLSGYTDDAILRHGVSHDDVAFLQKPYAMAALAAKVREVLEAGTRPR